MANTPRKGRRISISLPPYYMETLVDAARNSHRTVSEMIRVMIDCWEASHADSRQGITPLGKVVGK